MRAGDYAEIVFVRFESRVDLRLRPAPLALVAYELRSGRTHQLGGGELLALQSPPFPTSPDVLVVAFDAAKVLGAFLELRWRPPTRVVDLRAEFRLLTNGLPVHSQSRATLAGALSEFGVLADGVAVELATLELLATDVQLAPSELALVISSCSRHVSMMRQLFELLRDQLDSDRAELRGRYAVAGAEIESRGIPVDVEKLRKVEAARLELVEHLTRGLNPGGFYDGAAFATARFAAYVQSRYPSWPRTATGGPSLEQATLESYSQYDSAIGGLWELRTTLGQLRGGALPVGCDGRNRFALNAFASKTGRNQPSSSEFIFGRPRWMRRLISPPLGSSLIYVDYCAQELGIAAALSQDTRLAEVYRGEDPYIAFAVMAGAVPPGATKQSHPKQRELFKTCALGVLYGMGVHGLAERIKVDEAVARALLAQHRALFPNFWRFSGAVLSSAWSTMRLTAAFGWQMRVDHHTSETTLQNWPMQATAAEMMRVVCVEARRAGLELVAPVHDGFILEARVGDEQDAASTMQAVLGRASRVVLDGFELRSTVECVVRPRGHFPVDGRARRVWRAVDDFLATGERGED